MTLPETPPARRRWLWPAAGLLFALLCCPLLPCANVVRNGEGWARSANSLRQINWALHAYHDAYGSLPPAVVCGKDGRPLYSWRVVILPFLEEEFLFDALHLDEPWDSPHNKPLLEEGPKVYSAYIGSDPPGLTRYQVFVGPGTAFESPALTLADLHPSTLLAVESGEPVPWAKPGDLTYDPDGPLPPLGAGYTKPVHFLCYEVSRKAGFNACFADGSCRFIRRTVDDASLRAVITRGGKVDLSKLE